MLISILQINALGAFDYVFARLKRRHSPLGLDFFKYFIIPFFVLIISIPVVNSGAADLTEIPPFNDELDKILKKELPPNCEVSCQLADLQSGRILMEKNPNKSLSPASTLKVITSASALTELGSNFRFLTAIYTDDIRSGSVGNLFVKGYGDPHLVTEELFALVHELIDNGLIEIRGSIVVDDSYFTPDKPLDATDDPGYRSYDALYSALSLNFNSLKITVIPGVSQSMPARLIVDPASDYATVSGRVQTVAGSQSMKIDVLKKPGANDTREHVIVRGTIGVGALSKGKYVNIQSPAMYTGYVLKELLLKEGIKVKGGVVKGLTPPDAIPYFEHQSMPLGLIVYWLGKMSSNFMAEQICLAMGAHAFGAPGTREKGLDVMRKFLVKAGVTQENLSLVDASGLSRDNKISASALVKTLAFVSHNFYCSPEFISSLGISGVDGTLKEKFTQDNIRRRIRAKTGTLRGVNALAGFGLGKNGKPIVFAILVNSSQKGAGLINYADRVIRSIFSRCLSR